MRTATPTSSPSARAARSGSKAFRSTAGPAGGGHSQRDCAMKGKNGGKGWASGKDLGKGSGKNTEYAKGYGGYTKGYGDYSKGYGGAIVAKASFGCGALDHVIKDCPHNQMKVMAVEEEPRQEIVWIGKVAAEDKRKDAREQVPWKVPLRESVRAPGRGQARGGARPAGRSAVRLRNSYKVLGADDGDSDGHVEMHIGMVECVEAPGATRDGSRTERWAKRRGTSRPSREVAWLRIRSGAASASVAISSTRLRTSLAGRWGRATHTRPSPAPGT